MGADENQDEFLPPVHTNTFGLPQEHKLLLTYELYKPSLETRRLKSEQGRTVYAETFIEHINVGTLSDLCVRSMAKAFGQNDLLPIVSSDPLKLRIHYDSLSVDLPLDECYLLTDEKYWRRVVLSRMENKALAYKQSHDWKSHAISLKFVDLVEACPAEYWPEEEMQRLALKIKEFVTEIHIRKLQSLQDRSFQQYFGSDDEDSLGSIDSTDISSVSATELSSVLEEEELDPQLEREKSEAELELKQREAKIKAVRRAEQHKEHEEKRKALEAQLDRRRRRELKRLSEEKPPPKQKKKKAPKIRSVFDIDISEEEDNGEDLIPDKRNVALCLHKLKKYKYPAEHCHHIDLSFLRFFDNLVSFSIEFQGPQMQRDYHSRHFNFSYNDVQHLAFGVSFLHKLQTFRMRNSRMDAQKLEIILKSLRNLEELEVVDFGYDQLQDDCGQSLYDFFKHTLSVKSLDLAGNFISTNVLSKLGEGLAQYEGTLRYLGLEGNALGDEGLHALTMNIIGTQQVSHLCLTAVSISQQGVVCCIANELLRYHTVLRQLDIVAIRIGWTAAIELMKALQVNQTILHLDCRGCELDMDTECDVEVVLRRNRYIAENPYVGDPTKTEEEINEWVDRIKNKIFLEALEVEQCRADCREHRPDIAQRFSELAHEEDGSIYSLDKHLPEEKRSLSSLNVSYQSNVSGSAPFVYEPNKFDEEKFMKHVDVPGPGERYYYFQKIKNRRFEDSGRL